MSPTRASDPRGRNARVVLACVVVLAAMTGAAFAAVPLYRIFCQQTGFDGTARRAKTPPRVILNQTVTVRFDANVRDLPWDFGPDQPSQTIRVGQTGLAFFHVKNRSNAPVTAHASYNVVPESAGPYFEKLQCFCFTDQTLQPGQSADFPVVYFVDPRYEQDRDARVMKEITLSYTFYRVAKPGAPAPAAAN